MIPFTHEYLTLPNLYRILLLGLGFLFVPTFVGAVDSDNRSIDIFFSNSLAGEIESCG
jgi:hypothetical protein